MPGVVRLIGPVPGVPRFLKFGVRAPRTVAMYELCRAPRDSRDPTRRTATPPPTKDAEPLVAISVG